jgi:uncharacterized protein (TIGR02266 family)
VTDPPPSDARFVERGGDPKGRRHHARYGVELTVSLGSAHNFYQGLAENLSEGGLFIATHRPRPVGELLEFTVNLPDGEPIHGTGQVRWVRDYHEDSEAAPGMGLRFVTLDERDLARIRRFLDHREPLFFDED